MPSALPKATSSSGIVTDADGQRYFPASVRPDGSIRPAMKIRAGYVLPEDVQTYKNAAAESFRNKGSGGVPGAEGLIDSSTSAAPSANTAKNAKRREARKKAKAAEANGEEPKKNSKAVETVEPSREANKEASTSTENGTTDREKQARKLKKKLREARDLQSKKEKGENLLQEQSEKITRIDELIKDLEKLGFSPDGEDTTQGAGTTGTI